MIEITSPSNPPEFLQRVRAALPTPWEWHYGGQRERTLFYGKVKSDGFWAMKGKAFEKNSFSPVMVVRVTAAQTGSRITARTRLPYPVLVFMFGWIATLFFILCGALIELVTSDEAVDPALPWILGGVFPCIILIAVAMGFLARHTVRTRSAALHEWLKSICEG